jgi:demethylmenaquinone methyltransferase/2-methoxy-6-polyprenyl-1,4-benzoquinol methylase
MKNQVEYYKQRANEYEKVYEKPERQTDLRKIEKYLENQFLNQQVIEIGCGTGFWTIQLAKNCKSILGIDVNKEVIEIAKEKEYKKKNVEFEVIDLIKLPNRNLKYEGLFGGFIWSHIKKQDISEFLSICLNQIKSEGELIFIDNKYVEGSSTPINRIDESGNKYQLRKLSSGKEYEVVKNFPSQIGFAKMINLEIEDFDWIELDFYWIAKFKKRKTEANRVGNGEPH